MYELNTGCVILNHIQDVRVIAHSLGSMPIESFTPELLREALIYLLYQQQKRRLG